MARTASKALYQLWPRQQQAMQLLGLGPDWQHAAEPVEELLYGGEAGGGKSHLLRAAGVTLSTIWPGAVVPLFRRTYPELEETHIRAIQREVPQSLARYNAERHELTFTNGSILEFRYCEREADVFRYQSAEWEALLIDEATHFTEFQLKYLRSRVRSTRPGWRPVIILASNPGNVGHNYLKCGCGDAAQSGTTFMAPTDDGGLRRCFLRARLDDNPSLGSDYRRLLEGLPEDQRRALLEGDWDIFSGQFFGEWRRDKHTCPAFELPDHWTYRGIGVDYGYGAPWSCHFYARDEDAWNAHRIQRWYAYREFYATKVHDHDQAKLIHEARRQDSEQAARKQKELRWRQIGDPAMWNKKPELAYSVADVYRQGGVSLQPGTNERRNGWQCVRKFLTDQPDGKPGIIFMAERCPSAIKWIPTLIYDAVDKDDIKQAPDTQDHCADELRYFLMAGTSDWALDLVNHSAPIYWNYGGRAEPSGLPPEWERLIRGNPLR